jgi:glycosyltransferase involved in cell wall biosynthesis
MKILLASTSSGSRGGGELGLLYLGRALVLRGHELTLWASTHPRMDELSTRFAEFGAVHRSPYVNTYDRRGRSLSSYFDTATARRVSEEWKALAPDIVHLNKQNLEDGLDLLRAARLSARPSVAMIHITQRATYLGAALANWRDLVSRRALLRFPGLLVTTPGGRERDLGTFLGDSSRIRTVLNGVPIPDRAALAAQRPKKRVELGLRDDDLLFLAVGRLTRQKRPMLFLDLAEKIREQMPAAKFLWVGDGSMGAEWDRQVAARSLGPFVNRIPWQQDVTAYRAAADVFLHVADYEGLAFAILESIASVLPCAITPNLLSEMPFLDSGNSIEIREDLQWLALVSDLGKRAALGNAARQLAEQQFSFARMAADYEEVYGMAIGQGL